MRFLVQVDFIVIIREEIMGERSGLVGQGKREVERKVILGFDKFEVKYLESSLKCQFKLQRKGINFEIQIQNLIVYRVLGVDKSILEDCSVRMNQFV